MKRRVLIVDDSQEVRELIRLVLRREQFELYEAVDGEEGLGLAEKLRPDLILLDVMMPGIDGYEVCRRLKGSATTASVKVIILTANGRTDATHIAAHAGADAFVAKPFSLDGLVKQVDELLRVF